MLTVYKATAAAIASLVILCLGTANAAQVNTSNLSIGEHFLKGHYEEAAIASDPAHPDVDDDHD